MAGKGGAIPGNGRKSRAEEVKSGEIAREAITEKYGSLKRSFIDALNGKDYALKKFVFEHAFGKPQDSIKMDMTGEFLPIQIIQLPNNGRDAAKEDTNDDNSTDKGL